MKLVFLFFCTVCVVFLTFCDSNNGQLSSGSDADTVDTDQENQVFEGEKEAKGFLKAKRDPSPGRRKYYRYAAGAFIARRFLGRRFHGHGGHRYGGHRYHGGGEEEEGGGYYGSYGRYGGEEEWFG